MSTKRFNPLFDKITLIIWLPTSVLLLGATVVSAFEPLSLLIMVPVDVFTFYFLISPFFGYVELREESVFIKFGLITKREIPYAKIRGVTKERKFYSDSMASLKNSLEHVNIKYNTFDIVSVSVVDNDGFIEELNTRRRMRTL